MFTYLTRKKENFMFLYGARILVLILSFSLILSPSAGYAQSVFMANLPVPGTMVPPSAAFVPVLLKGMTIHAENPLQFDFIVDSGNTDFDEARIKAESERLVKYFLASMTIPKDDLWVNLSPNEPERIIPDELGKTELGRDMLAQDYILKQLTASLMYPEKELGKEFWAKVYKQAQEKYGTTEIPVDTFNKVWILPETATVYEHEKTVYIVDARLKVMLDADYLTMQQETKDQRLKTKDLRSDEEKSSVIGLQSSVPTAIIKEIILPAIEKEVNEGQNFAPLRQIYHSLILAKWYKETIKNSLLSKVYIDQKKTAGVESGDATLKDQIYAQYMEAYKKGVFNYIKEDYDQLSQEAIPRKYFSGGEKFGEIALKKTKDPAQLSSSPVGDNFRLSMRINPQVKDSNDKAMATYESLSQRRKMISDRLFEEIGVKSFETTVRLIKDLKVNVNSHVKRAVGTSSKKSDRILAQIGIENDFDIIVNGINVEKEGIPFKPAKEFYLEVAKRLGVKPQRTVVIEDSTSGVQSAADGGFGFVIGLARNEGDAGKLEAAGADLVLSDIGDLTIENITNKLAIKLGEASSEEILEGVIFDMDGVISDTEEIYFEAWKQTFDEYLQWRTNAFGEEFKEFSRDDYLQYAAGRPGSKIPEIFLASRGIHLPDPLLANNLSIDERTAVNQFIKQLVVEGNGEYYEHDIRLIFHQHIKRLQQRESVDFTKSKWLGRLKESFDFWKNQRQYYDYHLVNVFGDQKDYPQDDYTTKTERNERLRRVTEQFRKIMEKDFQERGVRFSLFSGGSGVGNSSMWNMLMAMEGGKYKNRFRKFVMHNSRERRPADQYKKDLIRKQMMPGLEHALEIILNNGVNGFDVRKVTIHNIGAYKDQLYKQINPDSELKEELNKILDLTSVGDKGKRIGLDSYGQALLRHPDYAKFIQKHQQDTNTEVVEPPYAHKEWTSTHLEISLAERIGKLKNGNYRIFGEFDGEAYYFLPQDLILGLAHRGEMATILFNGTDQQGVAISDIVEIINSEEKDFITVYETIPEFMKLVRTALQGKGLGDKFRTAIVSSIKKIAVIGADTGRGRKVYEQLIAEGEHSIVGIGKGNGLVDLDVTDENVVKAFINEVWPDVIVFPSGVDVQVFSKPFKKHHEAKNKYGDNFKFDIEMQFDGDFIPSVLIEDGYEILESPKRGGSSSQTFITRDRKGKKVVIKYADWEGISGNGAPWLRKQKDKLMYIQRKYPQESRSLYPKVLSYRDEGEIFYYVMEYFEGAEDITQYFLNAENLTPEQMYADVNDIISRMVRTHYSHPSQAPFHVYEGEIEDNSLNRALYRMKLLGMHKGSVYEKLLKPYKFQTVKDRRFEVEDFDDYPDISYFFEDLMRQEHIEINGRTYPNLPTLLRIFADNIDAIQRKLGPAHFSHYVHSDIALRNILRLPDGEIKLIDVRGVNVSPTSPSKVSIEYDLGKIAHSFLMEIARNDLYRMRAEKKDGQFSFTWVFDDVPGVQRYRYAWHRYREMLENNAELQELFKDEGDRSRWIDYVFLLESFNYLSDAIHRFSQDSTGKDPLIYYLYATMGLYEFLDRQGLLSSDRNELLTDGFKRNNSDIARGEVDKIVVELFKETNSSMQIIGFSGPTGAGKTSYANATKRYFEEQGRAAQIFSVDMFLTDRTKRAEIIKSIVDETLGIAEYQKEAWDMEGFYEMLRKIDEFKKSGEESLEIHISNAYNRETGKRDKEVTLTITRDMVVIIEGVRIVNQETEEYFDKTVMVDVDQDDILVERLIAREQDKPGDKRLSSAYVQERFNATDRENARLMRTLESEYYDYLIDASRVGDNVLYKREPRLVSPALSIIKNQIIQIEEGLGRLSSDQMGDKVKTILGRLRSGEVVTQGEEVDVIRDDSDDEIVVGQIDREIAERFGYSHRTANAIVLAPDGKNVILTRRAHNKGQYPYYLTALGGHVLSGQTYEEGIKDELLEELELDTLKGMLIEVDTYSYGFDKETEKDTTKERRKLFVYRLTDDEYRRVLSRQEELQRLAKGGDGEQKLKAELEARQFQGLGEVWSYHAIDLEELLAARDSLQVKEILSGFPMDVPFTPDLLTHLLNSPDLVAKLRGVIQNMPQTMKQTKAGIAFIFGTGNNGAVIDEHGKIYSDGGALQELGFNIIFRAKSGHWTFTGKETHGGQPTKEEGDKNFIDSFSGINLAKRFINEVQGVKNIFEGFIKLPEGIDGLDALFEILQISDNANEENKRLRALAADTILKGITQAFRDGNSVVNEFIEKIGREIGTALTPLINEYATEAWVENFIMVSGVGENFARIEGQGDNDIFVSAIREGLNAGLRAVRGKNNSAVLTDQRIQKIVQGIRRSNISREREILAARFTADEIEKIKQDGGAENMLSVGISLGGTKVGIGLISSSGDIKRNIEVQWREENYPETPASFVDRIWGETQRILKDIDAKSVRKIGVAFAGPVDRENGIVGNPFKAPNLPFENYALKEELKKRFQTWFEENTGEKTGHIIVDIYNDAQAAVLGEALSTSGQLSIDSAQRNVGGIDLNDINIKHQGNSVDIQFDPVLMQEIIDNGVDGFVPVIINLIPINGIQPILGLEPSNREEKYEMSHVN